MQHSIGRQFLKFKEKMPRDTKLETLFSLCEKSSPDPKHITAGLTEKCCLHDLNFLPEFQAQLKLCDH